MHTSSPSEMPTFSGIRVVIVAHGPPLRGGITTVAMDLVEDPVLNAEFDLVFVNTTQNEKERGKVSWSNVRRLLSDAVATFDAASRGAVVHTHSVQEPWPVAWRQVAIALAARVRGAAVVLHNHAAEPYLAAPGTYRPGRLNGWGLRVLDALAVENVLLSDSGTTNLASYFRSAGLPVVANSVVVDDVPTSSADHDPPVVLFVGELLARKGVSTLLDALDLIDARVSLDYELRIVGNDTRGLDPAKDAMIDEVHARGRGDCLVGAVPRHEVYRHLAQADVYVLPSDYEGQPLGVIEALSAGVPVVATRMRSLCTMYDDPTNGHFVDRTDTEGFADAIEQLLSDPDRRRRMSELNREHARRRFDRPVFRERIAELYRRHGRLGGAPAALSAHRSRSRVR